MQSAKTPVASAARVPAELFCAHTILAQHPRGASAAPGALDCKSISRAPQDRNAIRNFLVAQRRVVAFATEQRQPAHAPRPTDGRLRIQLARSKQHFDDVARVWAEALLLSGLTELPPPADEEEVERLTQEVAARLRESHARKLQAAADTRVLRRRGQALLLMLRAGGLTVLEYQAARRQLEDVRRSLARARRRRMWACLAAYHHPGPGDPPGHHHHHHHHHHQQHRPRTPDQQPHQPQEPQPHQPQEPQPHQPQARPQHAPHQERAGVQADPGAQQAEEEEEEVHLGAGEVGARGGRVVACGCEGGGRQAASAQHPSSPAYQARTGDPGPQAAGPPGPATTTTTTAARSQAAWPPAHVLTDSHWSVPAQLGRGPGPCSGGGDDDGVDEVVGGGSSGSGSQPQPRPQPQLAGYVLLSLTQPLAVLPPPLPSRAPHQVHVDALAVAPGWRRRGVGTALLREAERLALRWGATSLWLHVDAANEPAVQLYSDKGYGIARVDHGHVFAPGRVGGLPASLRAGGASLAGAGIAVTVASLARRLQRHLPFGRSAAQDPQHSHAGDGEEQQQQQCEHPLPRRRYKWSSSPLRSKPQEQLGGWDRTGHGQGREGNKGGEVWQQQQQQQQLQQRQQQQRLREEQWRRQRRGRRFVMQKRLHKTPSPPPALTLALPQPATASPAAAKSGAGVAAASAATVGAAASTPGDARAEAASFPSDRDQAVMPAGPGGVRSSGGDVDPRASAAAVETAPGDGAGGAVLVAVEAAASDVASVSVAVAGGEALLGRRREGGRGVASGVGLQSGVYEWRW